MARATDCYTIYEVNYELNETQPTVGQIIMVDEWDETGTTINYKFTAQEILEIKPYKSGNKWMLQYIIKGK